MFFDEYFYLFICDFHYLKRKKKSLSTAGGLPVLAAALKSAILVNVRGVRGGGSSLLWQCVPAFLIFRTEKWECKRKGRCWGREVRDGEGEEDRRDQATGCQIKSCVIGLLLSWCFSACLLCMFETENISSQWSLFRGRQFNLSSLFHIAPRESLPCCFFHNAVDWFLLLSWIFRNGTCKMQSVHIAALHRFWFLAWSHFSTHTLGTCTLHFTSMCIDQLMFNSNVCSCAWCHLSMLGGFYKDIHRHWTVYRWPQSFCPCSVIYKYAFLCTKPYANLGL